VECIPKLEYSVEGNPNIAAMNEPLGSDEPPPDLVAFPPFFGLDIPVCYDPPCGTVTVTPLDAYAPDSGYDPLSNPWSGFDLDSILLS